MIAVAIVAVLAAIAIPAVVEYQLRTKRAEVGPNTSGLFDALVAYAAAHDSWGSAPVCPWTSPGKVPRSFSAGCGDYAQFQALGWEPDGDVYCNYGLPGASVLPNVGSGKHAYARCDIDGDALQYLFGLNAENTGEVCWNGATQPLPCF